MARRSMVNAFHFSETTSVSERGFWQVLLHWIRSMLRSENPFASGSAFLMSFAQRGMTPVPQPSYCCRAASIRPMSQ
jgi:hypothetical protein